MNEKQTIPSEKSMKILPFKAWAGGWGNRSYSGGFIMDWELRHNVNPIIKGVGEV